MPATVTERPLGGGLRSGLFLRRGLLLFERGDARVLLGDGLLHRFHHRFEFRDFAALRGAGGAAASTTRAAMEVRRMGFFMG